MTVGVFANCTFYLKVKHLGRQQKKKLQTDIKENGGNVSLSLNPQCTHVILDSADVLSQYQLNSVQKNHVHIANLDFIRESIKERRLLDIKSYTPYKSLDSTPPPCQEASSSGKYFISSTQCIIGATVNVLVCQKYYTKVWSRNTTQKLGFPGRCGSAVKHQLMHQEVTGSIPSQGTCPGCGLNPQWEACRR
nr:poly(ADP-ribose) polymerase family member 4 [Molossus molossus]